MINCRYTEPKEGSTEEVVTIMGSMKPTACVEGGKRVSSMCFGQLPRRRERDETQRGSWSQCYHSCMFLALQPSCILLRSACALA